MSETILLSIAASLVATLFGVLLVMAICFAPGAFL